MRFRHFLAPLFSQRISTNRRNKGPKKGAQRLRLETLEDRLVPAGSWANLTASGGPANGGAMLMALSDGSILVQNGINPTTSAAQNTYRLSPQVNTGDYANGSWSATGTMQEDRLFFSTVMLPGGKIFAVGGEYPNFSNTAEIFDPQGNGGAGTWTYVDAAPTALTGGPPAVSQFGDDPMEVISTGPNAGQVLVGYFNNGTTYRFNPGAASGPEPGSQWVQTAGAKLHNEFGGRTDRSDEEAWVKLKDGSILSYDVWASGSSGTFQAQRYIPSSDTWVDASTLSGTNPPSILESNGAQGRELGPAFLQSDGKVIYFGANGNTAIFDPSAGPNGTWSAGFTEPQKNLTLTRVVDSVNPDGTNNVHWSVGGGGPATFLVGTDDPGAVLPNGHILITLSPLGKLNTAADSGGYNFPNATYIYDYDPTATTLAAAWTDVTPGGLTNVNAYQLNMVLLPTGQVLLSQEGAGFQIYTEDPATGPQNAWRPTISSIVDNGGSPHTYTLTGTQLNGIDEGANYGDDNESASNYPIIQFKDSSNHIFYGRTSNWSSSGVATGSTPVTTQFTLPAGESLSDLTSVTVIANGIPSATIPFHINPNVTGLTNQTAVEGAAQVVSLGSFNDPDNGTWSVDVNWGDGSGDYTFTDSSSPASLGTFSHTYAEEGTKTVTVTVTDSTSPTPLSGSGTFQVVVADAALSAAGQNISGTEGATTGVVTVATFTDLGGAELTTDYSATINWGAAGTGSTVGTIVANGDGSFSVQGSFIYAEEGNPTVTVHIVHENGITADTSSTAMVADAALSASGQNFAGVECLSTLTVTVATFTDLGGPEPIGDYSAVIDWGGAGTGSPTGAIVANGDGSFSVQGSFAYDKDGIYTVTTVITHENGITATTTSTATIKDNIGILLLDKTGKGALTDTGNGNITVTGCGAIIVDSTNSQAAIATGNGVVSADEIDATGMVTHGHGAFVGDIDNTEAPEADPLGYLSAPPVPATVRSTSTLNINTSVTLQPGLYIGGIKISGAANVILAPGIYYFQGGGFSVSGQATVTDNGQGVLLYNAPAKSSDGISFTGQGNVSLTGLTAAQLAGLGLSAPQYAGLRGMVIFQDRSSTAALSLTGQGNVNIVGTIYAAAATVKITGNGSLNLMGSAAKELGSHLIVADLTVTGNGGVSVDASNNNLELL